MLHFMRHQCCFNVEKLLIFNVEFWLFNISIITQHINFLCSDNVVCLLEKDYNRKIFIKEHFDFSTIVLETRLDVVKEEAKWEQFLVASTKEIFIILICETQWMRYKLTTNRTSRVFKSLAFGMYIVYVTR